MIDALPFREFRTGSRIVRTFAFIDPVTRRPCGDMSLALHEIARQRIR